MSDLTHDPNRKLVKEGQVYLKNVKKLYQVVEGLPWKPALTGAGCYGNSNLSYVLVLFF